MRSVKNILLLFVLLPMLTMAQNIKIEKTPMGKITQTGTEKLYVKQGEFKPDFDNKVYDDGVYKRINKYFVIVRDADDNVVYVKMNNHKLNLPQAYPVELLRAGFVKPDFVYIEKRSSTTPDDNGFKYYLHVADKIYGPNDGFYELFPNGYIYKNKDRYSFVGYGDNLFSMKGFEILDKADFIDDYVSYKWNDTTLKFKPKNDVIYYKTHGGHYYQLYKDDLMENTLMVVDGNGYELDGAVDSLMIKFSQDGSHWIVARPYNIMVDGVTVNRTIEKVKQVAIKNNGEYAFTVEGKLMEDKVYFGDDEFVTGVNMIWLSVDENDCFNYIFRSRHGYFYGVDAEITCINDKMVKYYYPDVFDPKTVFTVKSDDGKHSFVYRYDMPFIMLDGKRVDCPSIPHYAKWDEEDGCFIWNAIEDQNLYMYKIAVRKKKK